MVSFASASRDRLLPGKLHVVEFDEREKENFYVVTTVDGGFLFFGSLRTAYTFRVFKAQANTCEATTQCHSHRCVCVLRIHRLRKMAINLDYMDGLNVNKQLLIMNYNAVSTYIPRCLLCDSFLSKLMLCSHDPCGFLTFAHSHSGLWYFMQRRDETKDGKLSLDSVVGRQ